MYIICDKGTNKKLQFHADSELGCPSKRQEVKRKRK